MVMAQSRKEIVAQTLADQGDFALSAFVTSLYKEHPSLSIVVQSAGLKEFWETIRSQGGSRNHITLMQTMSNEMERMHYQCISHCLL